MADEEVLDKKAKKKAEKEAKKKASKKGEDQDNLEEEEYLGIVGKILMFFVALIIIVIWLAIFAILVKMNVGGIGGMLFPVLKDVPYVNLILPGIEEYTAPEDDGYGYKTLDEAITRIKELEVELENKGALDEETAAYIEELETASEELAAYKAKEAAFESEKEKFYEEVVFSDHSPDIEAYKTYYESIEPENAEVLYKQVVTQLNEDAEIQAYADTYSSMKPKNAAAIFDAMTDDFDLVCKILQAMETKNRSDILAAMNTDNAAIITEMMEP